MPQGVNLSRKRLYPEIEPYATGHLDVGDSHEIYYEQCGAPDGKPALFVHGGPGGGGEVNGRRFFNPRRYRIVSFDQRGCGQSRPHASLDNNTTWDLVADIERLREHLGIERWLVFGGSWGSTLSLLYAETHPDRVTELVLRGIFLLRRHELDWFYEGGAGQVFPDLWKQYVAPIPEAERSDLLRAYHRRLTGDDEAAALAAARAWSIFEGSLSFLELDPDYVRKFGEAEFALAIARIECHYFVNGGFLEHENQILANVARIRHIPGVIIHGRYDMICLLQTAWDLHQAWPEAQFRVVPDAGHSAYETGTTHELVSATDRFCQ